MMMYPMMTYRTRAVNPGPMIDRMIRDVWGEPRQPRAFRVDVRQTNEAFIIEAELPGVKLADIDVSVENDVLTIAADVNAAAREAKDGYLRTERRSGHMERSFTLEGIQQEQISASAADGVLTITLPKEQPAPSREKRKIAIGGAANVPALEAPAQ